MKNLSRIFCFAILSMMLSVAGLAQDAGDLMKQGAELFGAGKYEDAIAKYNDALKLDASYPQGYYNLGLAYFGAKKYAEAETAAIEALKRAPKNAGNHRLYALVTFHQNKRGNALLGFASFLLLEPNSARSAEAVTNMQSILRGGVLKNGVAGSISTDEATLNGVITRTVAEGQAKKLTGTNLLEYELTHIFISSAIFQKKISYSFFDTFYAIYLSELAQSGNMPAFAHIVAQYINKDENAKWLAANPDKVDALNKWVQATQREM